MANTPTPKPGLFKRFFKFLKEKWEDFSLMASARLFGGKELYKAMALERTQFVEKKEENDSSIKDKEAGDTVAVRIGDKAFIQGTILEKTTIEKDGNKLSAVNVLLPEGKTSIFEAKDVVDISDLHKANTQLPKEDRFVLITPQDIQTYKENKSESTEVISYEEAKKTKINTGEIDSLPMRGQFKFEKDKVGVINTTVQIGAEETVTINSDKETITSDKPGIQPDSQTATDISDQQSSESVDIEQSFNLKRDTIAVSAEAAKEMDFVLYENKEAQIISYDESADTFMLQISSNGRIIEDVSREDIMGIQEILIENIPLNTDNGDISKDFAKTVQDNAREMTEMFSVDNQVDSVTNTSSDKKTQSVSEVSIALNRTEATLGDRVLANSPKGRGYVECTVTKVYASNNSLELTPVDGKSKPFNRGRGDIYGFDEMSTNKKMSLDRINVSDEFKEAYESIGNYKYIDGQSFGFDDSDLLSSDSIERFSPEEAAADANNYYGIKDGKDNFGDEEPVNNNLGDEAR